MPVNKVEDRIHNLCELDITSRGQHLSQAVGGNWPVLDCNRWIGELAWIGTPPNLSLTNYSLQQFNINDFERGQVSKPLNVPLDENHMLLTPRVEYCRSLTSNDLPNANESLLGFQKFQPKQNQAAIFGENISYDQRILTSKGISILKPQHENECADSPTLTTNSERSEITEASSDFNFLREHQQLVRDQEPNASQVYTMQQPGYNDMHLLQRHIMLKQLHDFQRQQQLQQLGDLRRQNSLNQFSAIRRQATDDQLSHLVNGTPVHDALHILRNSTQQDASPAAQGEPNKVVYSQEQGQALRSMGLTPQQVDVSLYSSPISNTRGNMSQYPHLQGLTCDSVNLLAKVSNQAQNSMIQSSGFGNPYLGNHPTVPDLIGFSQGASMFKQEYQMKNDYGQVSVQGLNSGVSPGNLLEGSTPQLNTSVREYSGQHEQSGFPAMQQTKQLGSSHGLVPLDPMEAKILYNTDDNIWDAFGSWPDTSAGGLSSTLEHPDLSYAFPSIQSGSWSALMQSAVAEASSSDTGLQDEWSGLTFQNTKHPIDNQILNSVGTEKHSTSWVDNNLQSASSFNLKPISLITDSGMSSSFPGFQQPGVQSLVDQNEDICQEGCYDSFEKYNPQQKSSPEGSRKVQTISHSDNAWHAQMFEHTQSAAQHRKGSSSVISLDDKGSKNMTKPQRQMSNGPLATLDSYEGANKTHEMQQNYQGGEGYNDCSGGSSSYEQGHVKQLKFFGNLPNSSMSVDKASFPDFQGSSTALEEVPPRGDHGSNLSTTFIGSLNGSNVTGQTSEHILELLHKVDQSKDDSGIKQIESTDCSSLAEMPRADSRDTSLGQVYAQSSASQGFGLKLFPPPQRFVNSNSLHVPPGVPPTVNYLNSGQVNPESGEKNRAWLTPSLFQSSPPSHELVQRAHWDNKPGYSGPTSLSSHMNMQGNSVEPFSPNFTQTRSNPQMHHFSSIPVTSQSLQAASPSATAKVPPFNQSPFREQMHHDADSQQFPILDSLPKSQLPNLECVSQQGENSARPYNVWRNVPTQRQPFGIEPLKCFNSPFSTGLTNTSVASTCLASHGSNEENSVKSVYKSSVVGEFSNSQGFKQREEHPGKEILHQEISSNALDASQFVGASQGQEPFLDATALTSGFVGSHAQLQEQDLGKARHDNNMAQDVSEKNLESSSHSHSDHLNLSFVHQMHAMNDGADSGLDVQHAAGLGAQQLYDNILRFKPSMDGRFNSTSLPNSCPPVDDEIVSFPAQARDALTVKATSQTALHSSSQDMARFGYNDSHAQSCSGNVLPNHTDHGHVDLQMAQSWFKQYGALRNGQIAPTFDARLATAAAFQLSHGKLSQNLHIHAPLEKLDTAGAGQGGWIWPSTAAALVASHLLSSPCMLSSEVANQVAIVRPKKRKITTFDHLPWHIEVTQDSKRLHNISVAEEEWAEGTNRLIEKVEDEVEVIEEIQPVYRSKRRLILTTQLVQQLIRPVPYSIFSANSTSNYGIISYFISRLSQGDACSLANYRGNNILKPVNNDSVNSEELKLSESSGDQRLLEVVEEFIDRAKKLDNEFRRLDKTTSIVDIRAGFQELERFAVINRFAKFHIRGQSDASGASSLSATLKPIPQRHVVAFPMPRHLPEGVQCLSL